MNVCALVGGQFGSEGKGLILSRIGAEYDHHVRVGAANAGHTLYDDDGEKHVLQQIPCGAYANPSAQLYIGPGALISYEIMEGELIALNSWRRDRGLPELWVNVDYRAHIIQPHQIEAEANSGLAERIGSTSATAREGIGIAQAERVMRADTCVSAGSLIDDMEYVVVCDVPWELSDLDGGILLEGTQGTGLSLTTGPFPYVTSRNTTAAALCAECGVAPTRLDRVLLVARTYPIRVAGNSGPFHEGSKEIQWSDIDVDPETERTTVTKKIRRVATWSMEQVLEAVMLNGATELAITFMDYLDPRISGEDTRTGPVWESLETYPEVEEMVRTVRRELDIPITMLGTGPNSVIDLMRRW